MAEIDLVTAFNLHTPAVVALVGAGGKTSLLLALARALPGRVVCATTTRLGADQVARFPAVCRVAELDTLGAKLAQHGRCLLISQIAGEKALGVEPALPGRLLARPDVDWALVEADGARQLPIKAPAEHEPVMPPDAALVAPVMGIDALDGPLTAVAHRPERVRALLDLPAGPAYRLTPADAARLLTHPQGGLKDAPAAAQIIPFINKVHTPAQLAAAQQIARQALAAPRVAQVVIGAAQAEAPVRAVVARVTAVVLAAGESRRMGEIKQLLPWGATTVLGQTLRNVKASGVHDVVVVTGHAAEQTAAVAAAEGARSLHNPDYAAGEMLSSLQTAVAQLPPDVAAVLVVLADQPLVEPETLERLLVAFWQGEGALVAPVFGGRRGNPVLIGRAHFAELLALPPGAAPRALLQRHGAHGVTAVSDAILHDLDDPAAYAALRPEN